MSIRVLHVAVQVALIEDHPNGEITPGPTSEVQYLTVSNAKKFLADLPAELAKLNAPDKPKPPVKRAAKPSTKEVPK